MAGDYIVESSKAPVPQDERMTESEFYESGLNCLDSFMRSSQ
jgi:hypothetical protein